MHHVPSPSGATVSFDVYGSGPPLVLVHGGFSDHASNWGLVKPYFEKRFTVYAVARRGRGETTATENHSVEDEGADLAAVIRSIEAPVLLLGHSYGGQVSLAAATTSADRIRKLILYEPPFPHTLNPGIVGRLEELAQTGSWDELTTTFFLDGISAPPDEIKEMKASEVWAAFVADAAATLGDLRAIARYDFDANRFRLLTIPVLLQIGTESQRELWATDALAAVLPDARIEELSGQGHDAMTTAPELYAESVLRFLA